MAYVCSPERSTLLFINKYNIADLTRKEWWFIYRKCLKYHKVGNTDGDNNRFRRFQSQLTPKIQSELESCSLILDWRLFLNELFLWLISQILSGLLAFSIRIDYIIKKVDIVSQLIRELTLILFRGCWHWSKRKEKYSKAFHHIWKNWKKIPPHYNFIRCFHNIYVTITWKYKSKSMYNRSH